MRWADEHLERFGDFDGLIAEGETVRAATVHDRSCRFAAALVALGLAPGDRVLLWLPNAEPLVVAFTGAIRAGAAAIIASAASPPAEVARIVAHAGARVLVTTAKAFAQAPSVEHVIVVGGGDARDFDALIGRHAPLVEAVAREPDDIAQIVYTSGTTGAPKGVVYKHGTIDARYSAFRDRRDPGAPPRRSLCVLPMAAAFGAQYLYLRLLQKMTLVLLDEFVPEEVIRTIETHRVEAMWMVPAMAEALLALPPDTPADLSSLGSVLVGGSAVSPSLVARFRQRFRVRLTTVYGMTELGPVAQTAPGKGSGSVGRLRDGMRVRIVGKDGRDLPATEVGDVELAADRMVAEYFRPDPATAQPGGEEWFRTGDLGYVDAAGELTLVGRSKELIIQGGINVYPLPIVEAILRLEGVVDCAVIGAPHALLGEEVVACVVRKPGAALEAEDILAHARTQIDARRLPARVRFFATLPRNELGKVKADVLRAEVTRTQEAETELGARLRTMPAPQRRARVRDEVRTRFLRLVGDAPERSAQLDEDGAFRDLGLDSLGAVALANALGDAIGKALSPTVTFDHPTLSALVDHLDGELAGAAPVTEIRARERPTDERIAIIGAGCRLPGGVTSVDAFWRMLSAGVDATAEIERWDLGPFWDEARGRPGKTYVRRASLVGDADGFDAAFFGLSGREATALDPQHRLALETTWTALEDAALDPRRLSEPVTGVFLGISPSGYLTSDPIGSMPSMAAGRISHLLDLRGPALSIDTACSSALVCVHTAVSSLRRGECDVAIAGGVNVIASAKSFVGLAQVQALAADGRSKAFDRSADGFGRGEGCVMLVLRRLSDAIAARDRILAVVRGSAVNHDGRSASLTAPNGRAQEAVVRAALGDAGITPNDVDYIEAHGTGTALGDPIEVQALVRALAGRRRPLLLGSSKTNIGHLEAAAGGAGLLKAALVVAHGEVPPHLHFHELNPILAPLAASIEIPRDRKRLAPAADRAAIAGVTSMGMSGTNAHVLVEGPPVTGSIARAPRARLYCLSARTEPALRALTEAHLGALESLPEDRFADACFTASVGRAHFEHRLAFVADGPEALRDRLRDHLAGATAAAPARRKPKVAFLFTGQGSQYVGMGRDLYDAEPVFRSAIDRCAAILDPLLPRPLVAILFDPPATGELPLDDTSLAQPALFALEWALAELWRAWGIEPDLVAGHSLGEYVAAAVAGAISLEDALALVAARGRLMGSLPPGGAMVAVFADAERARRAIGARTDVAIAAINGPASTVVSGAAAAVQEITAALGAEGVGTKALVVSAAFHSPLMEPILDRFVAEAAKVAWTEPRIELVSTLTGATLAFDELRTTAYWRRHVREAVDLHAAVRHLAARGAEAFVEVGPDPVLVALARRSLPDGDFAWLASLRRGRSSQQTLLESAGALYTRGADPNLRALHEPDCAKVALPTYPFERQRFVEPANGWRSGPVDPTRTRSPAPKPRARLRDEVLAASSGRADIVLAGLAPMLRDVLGRAPEGDDDLVGAGLDSLRVMQLLSDLRRATGLELRPPDVLAHATPKRLADHVAALLGGEAVAGASRIVTLHASGSRPQLFCFHPAGGQVTAYLRLRALLGDEQPLFAIPSRALAGSEEEHASIDAMATDYANLVQATRARGPYRLLGWSMGGLVAHAVAAELERRGAEVERVTMIDPPSPAGEFALDPTTLAVAGIVYETNPSPPPTLFAELASARRPTEDRALFEWSEKRRLVPAGTLTADAFAVAAALYRQHVALVRAHRSRIIAAPIALYRAEAGQEPWTALTRATVTDKVFAGASHFTIVGPPHIDVIAADLRSAS